MTNVVELKAWRYAEPFRPFELVLDDGRRVLIRNPWNIGWSAETETVAFAVNSDDQNWVKFSRVIEITPARWTIRLLNRLKGR